jgi:DNA adenine methylase
VEKQKPVKPFLKWAGGKRQILKHLLKFLPTDIIDRTYREPFLGGGSLFFELKPSKAFLSDANKHLIMAYEYVRDRPDLISRYLRQHECKNCEKHYYQIRKLYNRSNDSPAQAARFIYLNKACYNGIFRVNKDDLFNVPYGKQKTPYLPTNEHLRNVATILKSKNIFTATFENALVNVTKNDFIYLDPPYPPLNGTSYFNHYTADKFDDKQQEKLAATVQDLDAAGCLFMVSNADTDIIQKLYKKFNIHPLSVTRFITCKSERHKVDELVITNY